MPINEAAPSDLSPKNETKEEEKISLLIEQQQKARASSQSNPKPNTFKRANIKVQKVLELHPVNESESAPAKAQARPQSSIVSFNRNIKVMPVSISQHAGLAKLQALAGSAHSSVGGANFVLKKPSLRLNRSHIQASSGNTSADVSSSFVLQH